MSRDRTRRLLAEGLGLGAVLLVVLLYLGSSALRAPTGSASAAAKLDRAAVLSVEELLPRLRLDGWDPGRGLGGPVRVDPLPLLALGALASVLGTPAAFELASTLGLLCLPLFAHASLRLLGFGVPWAMLGAAISIAWVFAAGASATLAPALAGDLSSTWGVGLAWLCLGGLWRAHHRSRRPWGPIALLTITLLTSPTAALWAALSGSYLLSTSGRPARSLGWLGVVWTATLALSAFAWLPLLAESGWGEPCCDVGSRLGERLEAISRFWLLVAAAPLGLLVARGESRRLAAADQRPLYLLYAALVGAALATARSFAGVDGHDPHLVLVTLGLSAAASVALYLVRMPRGARWIAVGVTSLAALAVAGRSVPLRGWGPLQLPGSRPGISELAALLRGSTAAPRVLVEDDRTGSGRAHAELASLAQRLTLRGVHAADPPYPMAAEAWPRSEPVLMSLQYLERQSADAVRRLRLLNVREVVAQSPRLTSALEARGDLSLQARADPYSVFRVPGSAEELVEPLAFEPVRSRPQGWRDKVSRWFTRRPLSPVHLVFTEDERFALAEPDEWLAPPSVALDSDVEVRGSVEVNGLRIRSSRPGHPLLVKIPFHPQWQAEGADGPFLVTPGFMLLVPRAPDVRLQYARSWLELPGLGASFVGLLVAAWLAFFARGSRWLAAPGDSPAGASRFWSHELPGLLIVLSVTSSWLPTVLELRESRPADLGDRAVRAYSKGRYPEAAEYARHALLGAGARRDQLLHVRGDSLLRSGLPREAAEAFEALIRRGPASPYLPQALFGAATAHEGSGDLAAARGSTRRLLTEFGETPWAHRLRSTQQAAEVSSRPVSP